MKDSEAANQAMILVPNLSPSGENHHTAYLTLSCGMVLSGRSGVLQYPLEGALRMPYKLPYAFGRRWTEPSAQENQLKVVRMQPRRPRQ